MPPRNSKFDEEYQIILGYKAELTRKWLINTTQNEQEYKDKRRKARKIFREKQYCLNQSWSKWKLLIITMKQRNFIKKWIV
jgi:hypothetical protein